MKTVKISKDTCKYLEVLSYEVMSYLNLISFLIKDKVDILSENYLKIYKNYVEKNTEYNIAKKTLIKKYNLENKKWKVNFDEEVIEIYDIEK